MNFSWFKLSDLKSLKGVIFIGTGVILVGELIWAGRILVRPTTAPAPGTRTSVAQSVRTSVLATVNLRSGQTNVKVGEKFTVAAEISTKRATDGTDLIITYDPKILTVVKSKGGSPMQVGNLYSDYPMNSVDEKSGRVIVSGISSQENGVVASGIFGTLTFQAKASGQTLIGVDFKSGSTTDSNVIEAKTGRDLLGQVNSLPVTVTP